MGYTTDFKGSFKITPKPTTDLTEYVNIFSNSRRMKRNVNKKYGIDGEFYTFDEFEDSKNIVNVNVSPSTQPGLWAQWIINKNKLIWNGGEKFYYYIKWLAYYINNFFAPAGFTLNGTVTFQGEDPDDTGSIVIYDNDIIVIRGLSISSTKTPFRRRVIKSLLERYKIDMLEITTIQPKPRKKLDFIDLLKKDN